MTSSDLMKTSDVARRLNVQPATVHRLVREGQLRGIKIGRMWRIDPQSVEDFIASQGELGEETPNDGH